MSFTPCRAGELEKIKEAFESKIKPHPRDVVIFVGDLNVQRGGEELSSIFGGLDDKFSTGYDALSGSFTWGGLSLKDVYSDVDVNAGAEGAEGARGRLVGTTCNSKRVEAVDYIFYGGEGVDVKARTEMCLEGCEKGIPDRLEGSDHIPLVVELEISN